MGSPHLSVVKTVAFLLLYYQHSTKPRQTYIYDLSLLDLLSFGFDVTLIEYNIYEYDRECYNLPTAMIL